MKVTVKEKVISSTTWRILCGSVLICCVTSIMFLNLYLGMLAGLLSFAHCYPVARREAEEEADRLIDNQISDEDLLHARRRGQRIITKTTELKNIHPGYPILCRLMFGDVLSKQTTYYLDDD